MVMLVAAVVLVAAVHAGRLPGVLRLDRGRNRKRSKRKSALRVVETDPDEFARSVERDLAALPTIDDHDR
jgi:hypothetical protein